MAHKTIIAVGICAVLVSAAILLPIYSVIAEFNKVAHGLHTFFQIPAPTINVTQITTSYEIKPTLELVTQTHKFHHSSKTSVDFLGSTKELNLEGDFITKVGFDLGSSFFADVSILRKKITIRIPEPKILSVELVRPSMEEINGWWNKITDQDRTQALSDFITSARVVEEQSSDLKTQAISSFENQLTHMLKKMKIHYTIEFEQPALLTKPKG